MPQPGKMRGGCVAHEKSFKAFARKKSFWLFSFHFVKINSMTAQLKVFNKGVELF